MPKKTVKSLGTSRPAKRLETQPLAEDNCKQNVLDTEEQSIQSSAELCELFQRIPPLVLEEIFDFLDAGHAARLGR